MSCVRDKLEHGESGGVILDAKLTAHRSGLEPSTITVATGRLIVGQGRRIGFLGGLEVTDEADDWLWNDVAAFEAVTDPALEDGLEL